MPQANPIRIFHGTDASAGEEASVPWQQRLGSRELKDLC